MRLENGKKLFWIELTILCLYVAVSMAAMKLLGRYSVFVILTLPLLPFLGYFFFIDCTYLILGYLALLPLIQHFSGSAVSIGDFAITPHMIIQFLLLLAALRSFLATYDGRALWRLNAFDKTLMAFVLFTFFSLIFPYSLPVNHEKRWLLFYTGIFETVSFYYILVYLAARKENFTDKILLALVLTSFSSAIAAIPELSEAGFTPLNIFVARMRIGFGYHNTNLFGIQSAVMFPIVFYTMVNPRFRQYRAISFLSFFLLSLLSLLCFNRGTFIVMAVEVFLLYFIPRNKKAVHWFLAAILAAAVYFNRYLIFYLYRFFGAATGNNSPLLDPSALYRLEAWKVGLKILYLYPFGVGGGGFQYEWQIHGPMPTLFLGTPHELFLSIGDDYGVLTMLSFMAMLVIAFVYAFKLSKADATKEHAEFFKYAMVSIIGFVVYGLLTDGELSHLTGSIFPNNGYTLILFTLFALITTHASRNFLKAPNVSPSS